MNGGHDSGDQGNVNYQRNGKAEDGYIRAPAPLGGELAAREVMGGARPRLLDDTAPI